MSKKEDLEIGWTDPSCSTFEMTGEHFPWFRSNFVILCFDFSRQKTCHWFDGKLNYVGDSNFEHHEGGLTKYGNLLTVGAYMDNQKTEILKMDKSKNFIWSVVEPDFLLRIWTKIADSEFVQYIYYFEKILDKFLKIFQVLTFWYRFSTILRGLQANEWPKKTNGQFFKRILN